MTLRLVKQFFSAPLVPLFTSGRRSSIVGPPFFKTASSRAFTYHPRSLHLPRVTLPVSYQLGGAMFRHVDEGVAPARGVVGVQGREFFRRREGIRASAAFFSGPDVADRRDHCVHYGVRAALVR